MTLEGFNSLDFKGKGEDVFANGGHVDDREQYGLKVQLYRLESFYFEVFMTLELTR